MKSYPYKIGAIFYALWGILHVVGASVLLFEISSNGVTGALAIIGSATPAAELPQISGGLTAAILAYYSFNLLWIGLFVLVVAIRLNWQNNSMGYWLNLAVVSTVDLGLIGFLLAPGHMAWADGLMGIVLWLPAVVFSTIGMMVNRTQPSRQVTLNQGSI